jgi:hypothetical protein
VHGTLVMRQHRVASAVSDRAAPRRRDTRNAPSVRAAAQAASVVPFQMIRWAISVPISIDRI